MDQKLPGASNLSTREASPRGLWSLFLRHMAVPQQRPVRQVLCPPREPVTPVPRVVACFDSLPFAFSLFTNNDRPTSSSAAPTSLFSSSPDAFFCSTPSSACPAPGGSPSHCKRLSGWVRCEPEAPSCFVDRPSQTASRCPATSRALQTCFPFHSSALLSASWIPRGPCPNGWHFSPQVAEHTEVGI